MSSKYVKKYKIPAGFKDLLTEFTREILRNQPNDLVNFGIEYFKCLEQGLILDYPYKGKNIPCDFEPRIPKMPESLKNLRDASLYQKPVTTTQKTNEIAEIKEEEIKNENKKNLEPKQEKTLAEEKTGESRQISAAKKQPPVLSSQTQQEEKIVEQESVSTPLITHVGKEESYIENCIDFDKKEEILESLKQNPENVPVIEEYMKNEFLPNKEINDLIALLQNTIMSYYMNKGTEKENEYNKLYEEVNEKIKLKEKDIPLISVDFDSMEEKDALTEFRKYEYYPKMLKSYLYKLNHISDEDNGLMDEMTFNLFAQSLKSVLSEKKPAKFLEDKEFIFEYFNHNVQLLVPELYSFVLGTKFYEETTTINLFTGFSFRKRELCHKFYQFYHVKHYGRPERKKAELLEKYIYVSNPSQILDKLNSAKEDNEEQIKDMISDKLQQNYQNIWGYISRVTNTPIELIESTASSFMQFNTTQRNIILKYLSLGNDFKEIYKKLSDLKIEPKESNFVSVMRQLYFDIQNIPELSYRSMCIYHNKLFEMPQQVIDFLKNFENLDQPLDEEKIVKEYLEMDILLQEGIFLYTLILSKEKPQVENIVKLLKLNKEKVESDSKRIESEILKENFTIDSDEFMLFIKEFKAWKKNIIPEILEYFNKEGEQKKEYFSKLNDNERLILYNILVIENNYSEEDQYKEEILDYSSLVPPEKVKKFEE